MDIYWVASMIACLCKMWEHFTFMKGSSHLPQASVKREKLILSI